MANNNNLNQITHCEATDEQFSRQGGMAFFVQYLKNIEILPVLATMFPFIKKNRKGSSVEGFFKQILCFFFDGTSKNLTHFDHLKSDPGYAATIETKPEDMVSSHAVKRRFNLFPFSSALIFRRLLRRLFIWRLIKEKPQCVHLDIDSMVMDNDDAKKRHGVKPTYKGIKGFHPLQIYWGSYIIDAAFRGGSKHCNYGNTVKNMVKRIVHMIREEYSPDVPIIITLDAGFFDQDLFEAFERLGIGYICGGKLYQDIRDYVQSVLLGFWKKYRDGNGFWNYLEFADRRASWDKFRRVVYCTQLNPKGQLLLPGQRPDTIIYTNLGMGHPIDAKLRAAGCGDLLSSKNIVQRFHHRGRYELVNRALKDFCSEKLPFKRFKPNTAYYYTMLIGFFLFECFKADVLSEVLPVSAYASTVRRKVIAIVAKIVKHSHKCILKVTTDTWNRLNIPRLWDLSRNPPVFSY